MSGLSIPYVWNSTLPDTVLDQVLDHLPLFQNGQETIVPLGIRLPPNDAGELSTLDLHVARYGNVLRVELHRTGKATPLGIAEILAYDQEYLECRKCGRHDQVERASLARRGGTYRCPTCHAFMAPVAGKGQVAPGQPQRRAWVVCTACGKQRGYDVQYVGKVQACDACGSSKIEVNLPGPAQSEPLDLPWEKLEFLRAHGYDKEAREYEEYLFSRRQGSSG